MNALRGSKQEVAGMAWPLAVGMLSFTLMGVVDTLLMGHVGTAAQAGVALGATLTYTFLAFTRGLAYGAQSLVAAADGAGDRERVQRAGGAALLIGLVVGLVAAAGLLVTYGPVLRWAVPDEAILEHAFAYLGVRVWALPASLIAFGGLAALQGLGDMKARMWVSLAGNLLNIALSLVLIFGVGPIPALGAAGAAIATAASTVLMMVLYLIRFVQLFGWPVLPGRDVLRDALEVGLPAGVQGQLGVLSFVVMNLVMARIGAAHLAASQIVFQLVHVSFLPGLGVGEATGVLVGRYLGRGQPEVALRALRSGHVLAAGIMGVFGVLFAVGGGAVASLFTRDVQVAQLAGTLMLFAASFQLFDALATVNLCALRGAGDTRFTLLATSVSAWGLTVPFTVGFGLWLGWGAVGAWLGLTIEVAALAAVTGWRVRRLGNGVGRLDLLLGEKQDRGSQRAPVVAAA